MPCSQTCVAQVQAIPLRTSERPACQQKSTTPQIRLPKTHSTAVTPLTFPLSPPTAVTSGPTRESSVVQKQTMPVRTGAACTSQKNCWRPQWLEDHGQGNQARKTDGLRQGLPAGPETNTCCWKHRETANQQSASLTQCPQSWFLSSSPHHPELRQRSSAVPKSKLTTRSLALSLDGDSLSTGSEVRPATRRPRHKDQKTEEGTEIKEQNTHSMKTNSEISTKTYNHPKPRWLGARVRTQSTIARAI